MSDEFIFKPENYSGPIAIDCKPSKECDEYHKNSKVYITLNEEITPEEEKRRIEFLLEEHVCSGASNASTWLVPISREFWLKLGDKPKSYTYIKFCPYCGYEPSEKKKWW